TRTPGKGDRPLSPSPGVCATATAGASAPDGTRRPGRRVTFRLPGLTPLCQRVEFGQKGVTNPPPVPRGRFRTARHATDLRRRPADQPSPPAGGRRGGPPVPGDLRRRRRRPARAGAAAEFFLPVW